MIDRYKSQGVLIVSAVSDQTLEGKGSLVEVLLFYPAKDARPDIQAGYDLASVGEVKSIHGPYSDPPRWTVTHKGRVSAKKGDWIKPKHLARIFHSARKVA